MVLLFIFRWFYVINCGLLPYQLVIRHAVLLYQLLDTVDVLLRNTATDVDADVVILADGHFFQIVADVLDFACPRGVLVLLPVEAVVHAMFYVDGRLDLVLLRRNACEQNGQFGIDVAFYSCGYLNGRCDEVDDLPSI